MELELPWNDEQSEINMYLKRRGEYLNRCYKLCGYIDPVLVERILTAPIEELDEYVECLEVVCKFEGRDGFISIADLTKESE